MAYEFKSHTTLVAEEVTVLTTIGVERNIEIVAETTDGYYCRDTEDEGQEFWFPKSTIVLIKARSRHLVGTDTE